MSPTHTINQKWYQTRSILKIAELKNNLNVSKVSQKNHPPKITQKVNSRIAPKITPKIVKKAQK